MSWSKDKCNSDCKENWENYGSDNFEECLEMMTSNYGCGASCQKYSDIHFEYNKDIKYNDEKPWKQVNDDCWIDTFLFGLVSTDLNSVFSSYLNYLNNNGGKATEVAILISNYIGLLRKPDDEKKQILKFKLIETLKEVYNNDEGLLGTVSEAKACKYTVGSTVFLGSLFKSFQQQHIGYYLNDTRNTLKNIIAKTCQNSKNDIIIIDSPSYKCDDCDRIPFKDIISSSIENGYKLRSIVIGNSIHYVNYSKINHVWMFYDNQASELLEPKSHNDVLSFNNNSFGLKSGEDITLFFLKDDSKKDGSKRRSGKKDGRRRSGGARRIADGLNFAKLFTGGLALQSEINGLPQPITAPAPYQSTSSTSTTTSSQPQISYSSISTSS